MNTVKEIVFEDGLTTLTLEELKKTLTESQIGYGPERMDHFEFIEKTADAASQAGLVASFDPIYVRSGGPTQLPNVSVVKREAEKYGVKNPLEAYLIRKLVTRIHLTSPDGESYGDRNMALAIGYNQRGYQLAYGVNVHVCSNMSIWGDNYMQTYGTHRTEMPNVFERLSTWMSTREERVAQYNESIQKMMNTKVNNTVIFAFVGFMLDQAVRNVEDTLKINQVSFLARNISKAPVSNVWELYNHVTNTLNPEFVRDFEPIYRQNIKIYNELTKFVNEVKVPKINIFPDGQHGKEITEES